MAFDRKRFLTKLADKGEPSEKKEEAKALDPIEVFRLALHDCDAFRAAFIEAVKSVDK